MRFYWPIAKVDAEQRMVWGYASTEAQDDQGETVKREALEAALGDYMRFANIREMHQNSAVGVAKEAEVDERGLYLGAKIVDDDAWQKVVEGVYKGFSIGGRITARDPADRSIITGVSLSEISIVDRPANPEAVFDCWKRGGEMPLADATRDVVISADEIGPLQRFFVKLGLHKGGDEPGDGKKPYGDVDYADPGYQDDKKKRYPLDTEAHIRAAWNYIHKPKNAAKYTGEQVKSIEAKIVAAWKDKIDSGGPPEAKEEDGGAKGARAASVRKGIEDIARIARIVEDLYWLYEKLAVEAAMEGDESPLPERLKGLIADLVAFQQDHAGEETQEFLDGTETPQLPALPYAVGPVVCWAALAGSLRKAGKPDLAVKLEQLAGGAPNSVGAASATGGDTMTKRSEGDQHLMDLAHAACHKCLKMDGMTAPERGHMVQAKEALKAAGAMEWPDGDGPMDQGADEHSTVDTAGNPSHPAPDKGGPDPTGKAALIAAQLDALVKAKDAHKRLMDVAHGCVMKLLDGNAERHPQEVRDHLHRAKFHLEAASAKKDDDAGMTMAAAPADLAKALTAEFAGVVAPLATKLEQLGADVEAIKKQPLPPATVAVPAGLASFTKSQDGGASNGTVELTEEAITAHLAKMSEEDRTLLMIKAAKTKPIVPPGFAGAPQLRAPAAE